MADVAAFNNSADKIQDLFYNKLFNISPSPSFIILLAFGAGGGGWGVGVA